ncbi:MAG TPA: anthranilate synthase component I family protein [Pedobacter sp.]|uniref:anthranilate synthase component I family protein n=1 Tax=Pedobacter sp. TaxID=1411316 RepID=UPI002BAE62F6|nr:anthranilate synthase component I family protein [Pedobacter sp.]HMI05459.1 anthranilate synthase component I family protein [Pedobacter sp.]
MKVRDLHSFKQQALHWAATFDACCCFDSNNYPDRYGRFDFLIAAGIDDGMECKSSGNAFESLKSFYNDKKNWMFGLMGYDLKNEVEQLHSDNSDNLGFPEMFFFVPKYLLSVKGDEATLIIGEPYILDAIQKQKVRYGENSPLNIQSRIPKGTYIKTVEELQQHILRGDIYEVNFCQEFFAKNAQIDPLFVLKKLNEISPTPFSGFFKIRDQYILSASPERFLCKRHSQLISQPIKGTAKRGLDPQEDELIKAGLKQDTKEQAENVMIVDLVRNDLTRSAIKGSVKVEELFGIYGFPQVYQMISTISAELRPEVHFIDAIRNAFPMGSMTGAPKIKAMELIEQFEFSKRGAYSGAFGYISPEGDFDFNVIIRSILYQANTQYVSFQVGGAITYAANAAAEYEECMLKASAMIKALGN